MSSTTINSCFQFLNRCQNGLEIDSYWIINCEKNTEPENHINFLLKNATLEQLEEVFKSREFTSKDDKGTILSGALCNFYDNPGFIAIESIALAALKLLPSHKEVIKDMLDFSHSGETSLERLLTSPVHPGIKAFFTELNDGLHTNENLLPTQLPNISFVDTHKWVIQFLADHLNEMFTGPSVTFRQQIRNASSKDVRDLVFSKIDEENHVFAYCFKHAHKKMFDRMLKIFVSKLSAQDVSQLKTELGQSVSYQSLRERPVNELTTLEQKQLSIYRLMDSNSN